MLNNYKRKRSTPIFYTTFIKKNAGEVSKYNITLAKKDLSKVAIKP